MTIAADDFQTNLLGSVLLAPLSLEVYGLKVYDETSVDNKNPSCLSGYLSRNLLAAIEQLWPVFYRCIQAECIPQALGLRDDQTWEIELTLVDNPRIRQLNVEYRGKDQPTDVLSFCLFAEQLEASADHPDQTSVWAQLPVVQLGSIFISVEYAQQALMAQPGEPSVSSETSNDVLLAYLLERFFHGCLHLMDAHHDTMAEYERVKAIQNETLAVLNLKCLGDQQPQQLKRGNI